VKLTKEENMKKLLLLLSLAMGLNFKGSLFAAATPILTVKDAQAAVDAAQQKVTKKNNTKHRHALEAAQEKLKEAEAEAKRIADEAEAARVKAEQEAEAARVEAERVKAEQEAEAARVEAERIKAEQEAEAARVEAERVKADAKAEQDRLAQEAADKDKNFFVKMFGKFIGMFSTGSKVRTGARISFASFASATGLELFREVYGEFANLRTIDPRNIKAPRLSRTAAFFKAFKNVAGDIKRNPSNHKLLLGLAAVSAVAGTTDAGCGLFGGTQTTP
jgi:chemosensory pili system protein ChpA (sensor histidine kinase/response regulator)